MDRLAFLLLGLSFFWFFIGVVTTYLCLEKYLPKADKKGSMILKTWIIVKNPGVIPIVKQPGHGNDRLIKMLEELKEYNPEAELIVASLAYGNQLWVESGEKVLIEHEVITDSLKEGVSDES